MNNLRKDALVTAACTDGAKWLMQQPDLNSAWATCPRGDWMIWAIKREGKVTRKALCLALCNFFDTLPVVRGNVEAVRAGAEAWAEAWAEANQMTNAQFHLALANSLRKTFGNMPPQ